MNSYHLNISVSWLIAILLFIIAISVSYFFYRTTKSQITNKQRYILLALRAIALCLLLFILFEPILSAIRGKIIEPQIAVIFDNSLSMGINDGHFDRKKVYGEIFKNLDFIHNKNNIFIRFDNGFRQSDKISFDSLKLDGQLTDLSRPLDYLANPAGNNNIKAVIIVSDGAINTGTNPIYDAEKLGKPVYTIGVGDTSIPMDIIVKSIITNENAQINSTIPVNVNLKVVGYSQKNINVTLYDNGEKFDAQNINISTERQDYSLIFEYKASKEGIRKITAKADILPDEVSIKNNSVSEFVNVSSKKKRITILAGAPGPDLTFILNALSKDKTVEIKKYIQKYKSEFYDKSPSLADIHNSDIFYLVGFPVNSSPVNIIQFLKRELENNKPMFLIASQDMDYSKLKPIEMYLPFSVLSSNTREYSALAQFTDKSRGNPLTRIAGNDDDFAQWNDLPPLFRTETFVKVKPESEILANVKINATVLNEPLIVSRQFSNQKTVAVLGYGLYRWKLSGFAQEQYRKNLNKYDLFTKFVENSNQWLTTDADKKNVIIKPLRRVFQKNEKVEFYAQVNDAAMNPVENAEVRISISGGKDVVEISLNPIGNGRYTGFADNLSQGEYYYKGKASKNGTVLGEDKGRFDIGDLPIEYLDIRMNIELLSQIAERTGGKFYFNNNIKNLENDIKSNKNFSQDDITLKSEFALWNYPLLLALSLLFFALEWFLRKRFGLL